MAPSHSGEPSDSSTTSLAFPHGSSTLFLDWTERLPTPRGVSGQWRDLSDGELSAVLDRLGFEEQDRAEVLQVRASVVANSSAVALVESVATQVIATIGSTDGDVRDPAHARPSMPDLPTSAGAFGRHFYSLVMIAVLPSTLQYHARRRIPSHVSWASLADLGAKVALHRREHGVGGLDKQLWVSYTFRGAVYSLGRLQIQIRHATVADQSSFPGGVGSPQVALHIPGTGPLRPAEVDESLARIDRFLALHFPEYRTRLRTCTSWLLDPQLRQYLPADANIIRFQDRFNTSVEAGEQTDEEVLTIAFGTPRPPSLPPNATRLQQAVLGHVRGGGHWRTVPGWFEA